MLTWLAIGLIGGVVLGLTGAGGAILAVPLFVHCLGIPIKHATVFSLFVVIGAALQNGWVQRRKAEWRLVPLFVGFSIFGSTLGVYIKGRLSGDTIAWSFALLCAYSLVSLWSDGRPGSRKKKRSPPLLLTLSAPTGIFVGILTALTGVGGGVFLVPWLGGPFGLPLDRAVPTSLFTAFCAATISLMNQRDVIWEFGSPWLISALLVGTTGSAFITRTFIARLSPQTLDQTRRCVLTAVLAGSILSVLL